MRRDRAGRTGVMSSSGSVIEKRIALRTSRNGHLSRSAGLLFHVTLSGPLFGLQCLVSLAFSSFARLASHSSLHARLITSKRPPSRCIGAGRRGWPQGATRLAAARETRRFSALVPGPALGLSRSPRRATIRFTSCSSDRGLSQFHNRAITTKR